MASGEGRGETRRLLSTAILLASLLSAGCASDGGGCEPTADRPYPTAAPESLAIGSHVTWGGILLETRHLRNSTELEISARALDRGCRPEIASAGPSGRFIVRYPGYLETARLQTGRAVRVSGRFAGLQRPAHATQPLPVITEAQLQLAPAPAATLSGGPRPWISIGVGAGSGWSGGGIGISF